MDLFYQTGYGPHMPPLQSNMKNNIVIVSVGKLLCKNLIPAYLHETSDARLFTVTVVKESLLAHRHISHEVTCLREVCTLATQIYL